MRPLSSLFVGKRNRIIRKDAKNYGLTIYGMQSVNQQVPNLLTRPTTDFDILAQKPKKAARRVEKKLDKTFGRDIFYTKPALHPGTHKVMDKGMDMRKGTRDDFGVVDYTKPKRKYVKKRIKKINYTSKQETIRDKKKSLTDKKYKFRHAKDRHDLNALRFNKRMGRW